MEFDEMEIDSCMDEMRDNDDDVLDESELYRLSYGAEHPETTDPLLYFLPAKRK